MGSLEGSSSFSRTVERSEIHVRVPEKLESHFGRAGAGERRQTLDARDHAYGFFDGPAHETFDFRGRRALIAGLDRQAGVGNVRK